MKESLSTKELIRDTLQKLLEEKDYAEISMKDREKRKRWKKDAVSVFRNERRYCQVHGRLSHG